MSGIAEGPAVGGGCGCSGTVFVEGAYLYFGPTDTDGSWRISQSGDDLIFEQRIATVWTLQYTITGGAP